MHNLWPGQGALAKGVFTTLMSQNAEVSPPRLRLMLSGFDAWMCLCSLLFVGQLHHGVGGVMFFFPQS